MKLARLRKELRLRRFAFVAIVISLTCLALSLTIRPAPQTVAIGAVATALDLTLTQQLLFEQSVGLKSKGVRFGLVNHAMVDGAAVAPRVAQNVLSSPGFAGLELTRLVIAPRSIVSLRSGADGCVTVAVLRGEARLDLASATSDATFVIAGRTNGASEFALCPLEPLELAFHGALNIEFQRNFRPNAAQSYRLSSLESATLAFPGLGIERRLVPLSGLRLEELGAAAPLIIKIDPAKPVLEARYVGDVFGVLSGPPGSRREQMPRLLEHLIGSAPLATMLAGFGFFWGLIWGLVKFSRSSAQA